jgi:hypothetical protein
MAADSGLAAKDWPCAWLSLDRKPAARRATAAVRAVANGFLDT